MSSTKTPGKEYLNIVWYSRHHKSFIAPLQRSVSYSSLFLLYKTWLCNIYGIWTLCMFITKLFDCLWLLYNVYNWNYGKFFFFDTLKYPHNRNNGSICFCQALLCKKSQTSSDIIDICVTSILKYAVFYQYGYIDYQYGKNPAWIYIICALFGNPCCWVSSNCSFSATEEAQNWIITLSSHFIN